MERFGCRERRGRARVGHGAAPVAPSDDADRIEVLRLLEELKCSAAGAQARISRAFEESQLEAAA